MSSLVSSGGGRSGGFHTCDPRGSNSGSEAKSPEYYSSDTSPGNPAYIDMEEEEKEEEEEAEEEEEEEQEEEDTKEADPSALHVPPHHDASAVAEEEENQKTDLLAFFLVLHRM